MEDTDNHVFVRSTLNEQSEMWDDTEIIKAYDEAIDSFEKEVISGKNQGIQGECDADIEQMVPDETKLGGTWQVGDYAWAPFYEDKLMYVGRIRDFSTSRVAQPMVIIDFLCWGNQETCQLHHLRRVEKRDVDIAQKKTLPGRPPPASLQEELSKDTDGSLHHPALDPTSMSSCIGDSSAKQRRRDSSSRVKRNQPPPAGTFPSQNPCYSYSPHMPPLPPSVPPFTLPGASFPNTSPLPPPPLPPLESITDDEALGAMLLSWYMTGYHTGFYQGFGKRQAEKKASKGT